VTSSDKSYIAIILWKFLISVNCCHNLALIVYFPPTVDIDGEKKTLRGLFQNWCCFHEINAYLDTYLYLYKLYYLKLPNKLRWILKEFYIFDEINGFQHRRPRLFRVNMYEIINHCIFSEIDPYSSTCFRIVIYTIYTYIIYLQIFIYIILLCIVYNIRSQTKLLQSATHCCFIRNEMIIILQQKWNRFYLLSLSR